MAAKKRKDCSGESNTRTISSSSLRFLMWMWSLPCQKWQMELVDLQCSDELKSRFATVGHADFWRKHILPTKCFPGLVDYAMRTVAAFSCTYCVSSCSPG